MDYSIELKEGSIVWMIKRLRPCCFGIPVVTVSDHQALESLANIGEHHPRVPRWMEFLSTSQVKLEYRKDSGHTNDEFLPRSDIDGNRRLTHPDDDVDLYFVRASGP